MGKKEYNLTNLNALLVKKQRRELKAFLKYKERALLKYKASSIDAAIIDFLMTNKVRLVEILNDRERWKEICIEFQKEKSGVNNMGVIMWDKPKKAISKEAWKAISADSAPPGVYTSNMSAEDAGKWKGKIVGIKLGRPQIELRKVFSGSFKQRPDSLWGSGFCANVVIIVGLKGFKYKNITRDESLDYNIHIAMNGGAAMTFKEMEEMQEAIQEAKTKLDELKVQARSKKKK